MSATIKHDGNQSFNFAQAVLQLIIDLLKELDQDIDAHAWIVMTPEDCLCIDLDGQIFYGDEGPIPIQDTHPNCQCIRMPFSVTEELEKEVKRLQKQARS